MNAKQQPPQHNAWCALFMRHGAECDCLMHRAAEAAPVIQAEHEGRVAGFRAGLIVGAVISLMLKRMKKLKANPGETP